ncbi:glycine cleavage system aminomethyltransferase GcvT [Persicimonas caeni]|uniref:Aminomethyltransferase n=1 Tax=Persicimonas caeni TaxID=2292766 RepID=A0A4Y6Q241_PERCE|nr:glycine cleavage system aminomethyltransferase GcvT [Persicimonas caeni]QDG54500.1 glycine cleavage system aminomethyltransferase GcvT [Persicimonas caeni]QED35721.1 glycine cleavage system aminomethyltransferase GcvT [Persicimonas caeni]
MTDDDLKHIPLEHRHEELGGRMTPFAGFVMPVKYTGIKEEHLAVRNNVGLFDVSHMGEVEVKGPEAIKVVDGLVTNDVTKLVDGQAMYAALCNEEGGIVDDLVLYRLAEDHVLICVNAGNRDKDFAHMQEHAKGDAELVDKSDDYVQLALQGPNAEKVLQTLFDGEADELSNLKYYRAMYGGVAGVETLISRTGYTGEDGFELYIPAEHGEAVFDALLEAGEPFDMALCGLGARDTLRLESKYNLYGQDMDESTNPIEAGLSWIVKLDKETPFVGQEAIRKVKEQGPSRRLRGLVLEGKGIIRHGYKIIVDDQEVGHVTSGSWAPTLEESIGLGYIDIDHANEPTVEIQIRKRRVPAKVTKKPFYKRD